ncbi:MAG: hypothetical protein IH996_06860 [Proteobacteria bacterium]|nr:hypothetical protein [Pseudomonadota bacterium]
MSTGNFGRDKIIAGGLMALVGILPGAAWATGAESIQVRFETSCASEVQAEFNHAVTLLHSFEYLESTRIFGEIIDRDPACAMARWGAAMSIWHPLWAPPSKADLEKGAEILAGTAGLNTTPREAAFIDALKAFYSSTEISTNRDRARAYEARMSELYANNLDDPEAVVFYALAVRTTADPRDKSYAQQFKSAGILNWVRNSHPTHPGVLHYLIHAYDSPGLAHLALSAAITYADAAPDSAHAQHMPSHIFTRLGLWDMSLASNHQATASAAEYTVRAKLPGYYDDGVHSMDYLMYAMLQTARDDEAAALLERLGNIGKTDTENFKVAFVYAASPARYALERRQWKQASELTLGPSHFQWQEFGWARAIHHFARGIGAARSGQLEKAQQEWATLRELQEALPGTTLPYWREEMQVEMDAVMSWILLAEGDADEALRLASAAADREDAVDKHPVTPGEVLPARELYADMLLETGDYAGSLEQYRVVLQGSPNRLNALLGAARAAAGSGDMEFAAGYYAVVREQTRSGNRGRMGLSQAWEASH